MKENYINLCFVVDESGSMYGSESDVVGGFKSLVEKQKMVENGKCTVSLFKFSDSVRECFVGRDVNDVAELDYETGGCTAMNDGIGTAIDRIGEWLSEMPEEERPMSNMVVVMTDGMENASKEYTLERVKEMIKHQTDKYGWTFVYMGTDITDASVAENLNFSASCYSSRDDVAENYETISKAAVAFRTAPAMSAKSMCSDVLNEMCDVATSKYEKLVGKKIKDKGVKKDK